MGKYSPTPIRYSGQLKSMEDVYRKYRNSISHREEYKSHESKISYGGFQKGFQKTEYLREQQPVSERKSIDDTSKQIKSEIKTETQNKIQPELKTTTQNDNELSNQKESEIIKREQIEEQKKELEKQDDVFYNDNSLAKYENDIELHQSDTMSHRRPSPYDKTELRW